MLQQNFRSFYILARQTEKDTQTQVNPKGREAIDRTTKQTLGC